MTPILSSSETTNINYLTVSVQQDFRGSYLSPGVQGLSQAWNQSVCWGCRHFKVQLPHVVAGEILLLTICWTLGLGSSLAVGWRRPSVLGYMSFSTGQLATWQLAFLRANEREREASTTEAGVFWKRKLKVTPHQVCLVLSLEASHRVQSTLKGRASHEA